MSSSLLTQHAAPRLMIKFITTSYMPLDKDIVREMWVVGDLKDRLGIKHRRAGKGKTDKLEFTPIFHEPHTRSVSEVSVLQNQYEPTMTRSPGFTSPPIQDTTLLDSPPLTGLNKSDIEAQASGPYFVTTPSLETNQNRIAGSSRAPGSVSPKPSYYSVSDLPEPSPIPPPVYRLTTGEITSSPPPRAQPLFPVQGNAGPSTVNIPPAPSSSHTLQPPPPNYGPNRRSNGSDFSDVRSSEAHEMRVRRPPHDQSDRDLSATSRSDLSPSRGPSEISYATAQEEPEEWWNRESHDQDHALSSHHPPRSHQHEVEDDRSVTGVSWDGGRAV